MAKASCPRCGSDDRLWVTVHAVATTGVLPSGDTENIDWTNLAVQPEVLMVGCDACGWDEEPLDTYRTNLIEPISDLFTD